LQTVALKAIPCVDIQVRHLWLFMTFYEYMLLC
jgi:hypothetical protein